MYPPLRIGVLGAARIAPKAICDPARVVAGVRLAGVAARNRTRAEAFAQAHGFMHVFDSYDDLIAADDIDLIYNPLPINHHAEWTIKALEAGKHVLCEKPFAMNSGEAEEMLAAADKAGKRLIEAFHYRYHPLFGTCFDLVKSGKIGKIETIDACFDVEIRDSDDEIRQLPETGGGAMMDLGCYPLSWTLHLLGEAPQSVKADAAITKRGVDESMKAQLAFPSGAVANLMTTMAPGTPFKADMTITGSEGSINFTNPLAPHNGGTLSLVSKDGAAQSLVRDVSPITTYTWQLAAILKALGDGTPLPTEGTAILTQQAVIDEVYAQAGLGHLRYR